MTTTPTLPGLSEDDALATLTPADADRFRIVVSPDPDADGPLEWGGVGLVGIARHTGGEGHADSTPRDSADPLDLARALDRFSDALVPRPGHWVNREGSVDAAIRWAAIFHGAAVTRWSAQSSQSDYLEALLYLEDDRTAPLEQQRAHLDGYAHALTQWATGEVYTVALERNAADDLSDPHAADWVEVGDIPSLGGCYLESGREAGDYTAAACVADNWGVPLEFAEAVEVLERYDY